MCVCAWRRRTIAKIEGMGGRRGEEARLRRKQKKIERDGIFNLLDIEPIAQAHILLYTSLLQWRALLCCRRSKPFLLRRNILRLLLLMYTLYLTFIAINFPSDLIETAYACVCTVTFHHVSPSDAPLVVVSLGNEHVKDSAADYITEVV